MNIPLVSIIIPIFNSEQFLGETLRSVFAQTYPYLEVIMVDDNSTDGSYDLALQFNAPNVIIKKNMGKGACAARNYGLDLSSGEYVQYLDADDLLSKDKIEKQIVQLSTLAQDYVANCKWGRFHKNKEMVRWQNQIIDKDYDNPSMWLADSWMGRGMGQTAIWLTPRRLIDAAGPWNEDLQLNQDGEFFCRVLLKSKGISFVKDCGVFYRSGLANSISKKNNYSREKAESLLKSYQLYSQSVESCEKSHELKFSMGNNFLMFMYQYHSFFPELSKIAENEFYGLGHTKMWLVGGSRFQQAGRLIGFKNVLKLRAYYHKFQLGKK